MSNQQINSLNQFPSPKVDYVFKWIFGNKHNVSILIGFLKAVLEISVAEYEVIYFDDPHLKQEHTEGKLSILDVRVTTKNGQEINIEMQVQYHKHMVERITFYNARLLASQLHEGDHYSNLKKSISILISDENIIKASPDYHHIFHLCDIEKGIKLTDLFEIHTLELKKMPQQSDQTEKYNWIRFFNAITKEEFELVASQNEQIRKAYDELKRLSRDKKAMAEYERQLKAIRDYHAGMDGAREDGFAEGLREGMVQKELEIAKELLKRGLSAKEIVEITKLSQAEVMKIQNE